MEKTNFAEEQRERITDAMRSFGATVGYLFGSYARGTANAKSDIDIAVTFPRGMDIVSQEKRVEEIRNNLERFFGADKVDVVNMNTVRNPLLLYLAALGEGSILFADDVSLKNAIAKRALREFEDTKYLRRIQRAGLKKIFA